MITSLRRTLHRFVPAQFHDPFGLAMRLIRSGDRAAWFAMFSAGLGVACLPFDLLLAIAERRRLAAAQPPARPMLLICGPPRSGTTLMEQTLLRTLPVAFINNLTSIFPRAPLTANRLLLPGPQRRTFDFHSYYGKSRSFSGPNDGLHLWDRWLGADRSARPDALTPESATAMARFFGAMEALYGAPIVGKNNSLNGSAHLVAPALPTARFLCLRRDPVFLAQSLLRARRDIHGSDDVAYGLAPPGSDDADPIAHVCRQVRFHETLADDQVRRLGADRFRIVGYEAFCADPAAEVRRAAEALGVTPDPRALADLQPFTVANRPRIDADEFARIRDGLDRLSGAAVRA